MMVLFLLFQSYTFSSTFFFCPNVLPRISSIMSNHCDDGRHFCLCSMSNRLFYFFTIKYEICWKLFVVTYYQIEILQLAKGFCHEWMLNFIKCFFFYVYGDNQIVFPFLLLMPWITLIKFLTSSLVMRFCVFMYVEFNLLIFCKGFQYLYQE